MKPNARKFMSAIYINQLLHLSKEQSARFYQEISPASAAITDITLNHRRNKDQSVADEISFVLLSNDSGSKQEIIRL